MNYYQRQDGSILGINADGSQDFLIAEDMVSLTAVEVDSILNPPKSLDEIKNTKWLEIKSERDSRKSGGVLVSGKWFHSDSESRIQQLALTVMGASVPPVEWKTMDGSFVELSQSLVGQIFQALASADIANFANAETHRIAMEASADPASYDYSTGWTPIYGE